MTRLDAIFRHIDVLARNLISPRGEARRAYPRPRCP